MSAAQAQAEDLDKRVGDLLTQVEQTTARVEAELDGKPQGVDNPDAEPAEEPAAAEPAPAAPSPEGVPLSTESGVPSTPVDLEQGVASAIEQAQANAESPLDSQVDAAVAQAQTQVPAPASEAGVEPANAEPPVADAPGTDAVEEIEPPSSAAPAAGEASASTPASSAPVPRPAAEAIATLDEQLASAAGSALDDEFVDPTQILGAAAAAGTPALTTVPVSPSGAAASVPSSAQSAAPSPAAAPMPSPAAVPTPAPSAAPAPAAPPAAAPSVEVTPKPKRKVSIALPLNLIVAPITPYLLKLGAVPEKTRQTIGWAALVTLFNAGVLWGWVLMQGPPDLAAASTDQPGLVGEDGTARGAVKGTGKPTAAGHDEHGAKSEAKAAKKDKTKKDEKAAKKDDHGGH